jgi:N,N'-diacetyllegionaminate synthase
MVKLIAEIGVNHNGSLDLALKSVDAAKEAGADCVKFQTWVTERIVRRGTETARYQRQKSGMTDQFDMLKELELSFDSFLKIKSHCDDLKIEFLSTPDDFESLYFLTNDIGLKTIKIGSGEIGNYVFMEKINEVASEVILSTGMCSLSDVEKALAVLDRSKTIILHCTTSYPTEMIDVNLNAMLTMRDAFKARVGYSDHTNGSTVAVAAVALGAEIIEKHFTLDCTMSGPDHAASADPSDFKKFVSDIRNTEVAMGDGVKCPRNVEAENRKVIEKRIFARSTIEAGQSLSLKDVDLLRADVGLPVNSLKDFLGKQSLKEIPAGSMITRDMFT